MSHSTYTSKHAQCKHQFLFADSKRPFTPVAPSASYTDDYTPGGQDDDEKGFQIDGVEFIQKRLSSRMGNSNVNKRMQLHLSGNDT